MTFFLYDFSFPQGPEARGLPSARAALPEQALRKKSKGSGQGYELPDEHADLRHLDDSGNVVFSLFALCSIVRILTA